MTDAIPRDEIRAALGWTTYDRFLVYVMGSYKSFNFNYILSEEELVTIDTGDLPGPVRKLFAARDEVDGAPALLRRVQGTLRADPGINAFLAVDVDLSTDEVDAVTQSLAFAVVSNVTVFMLPPLGHNLGVGEEAGSVFERPLETHGDRIVFVHEAAVASEMTRAVYARWDLRAETYDTRAELHRYIRLLVADVMNRKLHGDLDRLDWR